MKLTLCTLYNSLYLDKGLVLYDSLKECAKDFELYVLCMDDKCFEVLSDIDDKQLIPLELSSIENEIMIEARANRSFAEYCWTCSSRLIQYILYTFRPDCCTYIDADMYFYHDPQVLVDEMLSEGKSVMMVPHRFTERNIHLAQKVGSYCVEFNSFMNDEKASEVLTDWHKKCIEFCGEIGDGVHWGDQKYMDEWVQNYPSVVHPCNHLGAGVAPWNIELYKDYRIKDNSIVCKLEDQRIPLVFFHFQSLSYISRKEISTGVENKLDADYQFIDLIYRTYLEKVDKKKKLLCDKYGINLLIKRHPASKHVWWKELLKNHSLIRKIKYSLMSPSYYVVNLK